MPEESITLEEGKYKLIQRDDGGLDSFRYGEPWGRDLIGDKLVYAMFCRIKELEKDIEEINSRAEDKDFLD